MIQWTYVVIYCAALTASAAVDTERDWLEVYINQGPVRGHRDEAGDLFVFYNIPYATAPTGDYKFKGPLPPPEWTETFDAVNKGIVCPQLFFKDVTEEQCLVANVFVPDNTTTKLPVLIYVHGGSFQGGFGNWLQVKKLMQKDMIVVNFNYRLGIPGFLCLGTEDVPGNAGIKDQVALLRWVQQNIAAFGGNPNDVTLAGYSAGSSSVDLLMILKATEGLFHKIVPESGSNLSVFALQLDPLQNAKDFAKLMNLTNVDNISELEKFYKTLSYEALTEVALDSTSNTAMFSICVEPHTLEKALVTEAPIRILKRGDYKKVPMLYGFSNMEGLVRVDDFDTWKEHMNVKFSDYIPGDLIFDSEAEKEEIAAQIKKKYFGDKAIDNDSILSFVDFSTDSLFAYATLRSVKLYVEAGNDQVYLYRYSFVDEDTPVVPHTDVRGAEHCAQSIAVSDGSSFMQLDEEGISEEYKVMKDKMRDIWRNFILTGKPVPEGSSIPTWPATNTNRSPHMSLGVTVELSGALLEDRAQFWDAIYDKYYREPIPARGNAARLILTFILHFLCISMLLVPATRSYLSYV